MPPVVALTDTDWFDYLASISDAGRLDEAFFWFPKAKRPFTTMTPGEPVFLRLKTPRFAIGGYGFFAHADVFGFDEVWDVFGPRTGFPTVVDYWKGIGSYRSLDLVGNEAPREPLGGMILRDLRFWPPEEWIPWRESRGWKDSNQRGKREEDPERAGLLLATIANDAVHRQVEGEFASVFVPYPGDERRFRTTETAVREGQGTFRSRVLAAYDRRCAITGERTEIVVDAAHIQAYRGPRSNHVQNGIALTKEFHTLFDQGYVGVTPEYVVRVSPAIKARWSNGRRYYEYDGRSLSVLPRRESDQPSREALALGMARFRA